MKHDRVFIALSALSLILAACGGGGPTQAPGGATTNPGDGGGTATDVPQATDGPVATQSGGGPGGGGDKPAGWDQYGKVHIELTGPAEMSGDYGFVPAASLFGGAQGSSLNFTNSGTSEIVSIVVSAEGKVLVSYASEDIAVPAAECTTSNWNIGATSGSGSFDCEAGLIIVTSGATLTDGRLVGTFEARAL